MFSRQKKTKIIFIAALGLLIFLIIFYFNFIKSSFVKLFLPFESFQFKISRNIINFKDSFLNLKLSNEENELLKQKEKEILIKDIEINKLKKENDLLRLTANLNEFKPYSYLLGNLIFFDPVSLNNSFAIDIGEQDGLKINMPVLIPPNILVGKIIKVYKNYSFVQSIFDSSSKISAKTESSLNQGIVRISFGQNLIMEMMSKDKNTQEGEIILTSGADGIFPQNLILGKIKKIKTTVNDLFLNVEVDPIFNLKDLENVLVLTSFSKD